MTYNKFTQFYIYIHANVNGYYTLTLAQNVNKFHYGIYIYMKCKSQTITCITLPYYLKLIICSLPLRQLSMFEIPSLFVSQTSILNMVT